MKYWGVYLNLFFAAVNAPLAISGHVFNGFAAGVSVTAAVVLFFTVRDRSV